MKRFTFSLTQIIKACGSCSFWQHEFTWSLHPALCRAPVILMAAATAGFGIAAYCDEDEDDVDEELVVTAPALDFCEREENFSRPECSGDVLGDPNRDGSATPDAGPGDDNVGGGQAMPNNAQDADGDEIQDCWRSLTSNENAEIESRFGNRDRDGDGEPEFHNGTDIGVATGTRLYAAKSGTVVETERRLPEGSRTYTDRNGKAVAVPNGNFVRINYDDGTQGVYVHMLTVRSGLNDGDPVAVGDYVGKSNDTGNSDGPHLHYSEWNNQDTDRPAEDANDRDKFNNPEETHDNCEEGGAGGE